VICVSNAIKDYIQEHYQVPDEKIAVIPRGVDLQLFDPERVDSKFVDELTEKYRLKGRFVVTAIGRITQLKDYETFIRGIVAAREIIPEVCGLIVGGVRQDKQAYFQLLQILVKDLGVEGIVHFVGSQQKIAEIYALSNIVVTCSRKPESFGRTAAEALAMNVPVIATRHGGVMDIVKDGVSGVLIAIEDVAGIAAAISKYRNLEVGDLRETVVNNFSLQQMVNRTLSLYLDLTCGDIADANFRSKF
jgi:glycosyltransferase involved in cell wall biosynthesis